MDYKTHTNCLFTILSILLHKQLVKVTGLQLLGSEESFLGFGIATMVAFLQESGKILDSQMELKIVSSRVNKLWKVSEKIIMNVIRSNSRVI